MRDGTLFEPSAAEPATPDDNELVPNVLLVEAHPLDFLSPETPLQLAPCVVDDFLVAAPEDAYEWRSLASICNAPPSAETAASIARSVDAFERDLADAEVRVF